MLYHFNEDGSISPVAPRINDAAPSDKTTYSGSKVEEIASNLAAKTDLAPAFSTEETYIVGDIVTYQNKTYQCKVSVTTAGAWDSFNWEETTLSVINDTKAEMSAIAPEWSPYMAYKRGDYVTYKGRLFSIYGSASPSDNFGYNWKNENSTGQLWYQFNATNRIVVVSSEEDIKAIHYPIGSIIIVDDELMTMFNNTAKTKRTNYVVVNGVGPEWKTEQGVIGATIFVYRSFPNVITLLSFGFIFTLAAVEGIENCVDANEKLTVEKVNGVYTAAYPNTDIRITNNTALSGGFSKGVAKTAASNPLFARAWAAYLDENNEEKIEYSESAVYVWKED